MIDARLARGVEYFNSGRFFECHDVLEELWMETRGADRLFLQGLIQVAVAFYHYSNRNYRGSRSQFAKGLDKLGKYRPSHLGIELERFTQQVGLWLARTEQHLSGTTPHDDGLTIPNVEVFNSFPTKENSTWQQ